MTRRTLDDAGNPNSGSVPVPVAGFERLSVEKGIVLVLIRTGAALAALALTFTAAFAATPARKATLSPIPHGTEAAFVASIQKERI